jgi:hypothetical protein
MATSYEIIWEAARTAPISEILLDATTNHYSVHTYWHYPNGKVKQHRCQLPVYDILTEKMKSLGSQHLSLR